MTEAECIARPAASWTDCDSSLSGWFRGLDRVHFAGPRHAGLFSPTFSMHDILRLLSRMAHQAATPAKAPLVRIIPTTDLLPEPVIPVIKGWLTIFYSTFCFPTPARSFRSRRDFAGLPHVAGNGKSKGYSHGHWHSEMVQHHKRLRLHRT